MLSYCYAISLTFAYRSVHRRGASGRADLCEEWEEEDDNEEQEEEGGSSTTQGKKGGGGGRRAASRRERGREQGRGPVGVDGWFGRKFVRVFFAKTTVRHLFRTGGSRIETETVASEVNINSGAPIQRVS
jgi:hypothetical protein